MNGEDIDLRPDPASTVTGSGDRLRVNGGATALVRRSAGKIYVSYKAQVYVIEPLTAKVVVGASNGEVHAPIPGAIV